MSAGFWAVLGVEATRDLAVIKRAYAVKLRDCHPEDDPEGFQRLRAAYESALRYATPRKPRRFTASIDPKARRKSVPPPVFDEIAVTVVEPKAAVIEAAPPEPAKPPVETEADRTPVVVAETRTQTPKPHDATKAAASEPEQPVIAQANDASPLPTKTEAERTPPRVRRDPMVVLQAQHDERCRALWLMAAKGAEAETMRAALAELLASEPMESVGIHGRTERWLADLIVNNTPRSDPLVTPAIKYFGWRADRLGREGDSSKRVLARADDLAFLEGLGRRQGEHGDAWRALNAKPTRMRACLNRVTPSLASGVRALLKLIGQERPALMKEVDPDGLTWWQNHFERPQIRAEVGWTAFLGAFVFTLILSASRWFGPMPWALLFSALACFGAVAAVLWGGLYGVARPRDRWLKSKRFGAPMWRRLGWAPATMTLVLVAALAPASRWVTPAIAIGCLWLVYWVSITGEPDRRDDVGQAWKLKKFWNPIWMFASIIGALLLRPGLRFPWKARAIFNFTYLAFFWIILAAVLPGSSWSQLSLSLLAGMIVFSWGAGSLIDAWRNELSARVRRGLRWTLVAVIAAAFAALPGVTGIAELGPLAAALCAVAVFAHKTLDSELGPKGWMWRDLAMRYGWLVWISLLTPLLTAVGPPLPRTETLWGAWLLTGPAIVAGVTVLAPLLDRRSKPKPRPA